MHECIILRFNAYQGLNKSQRGNFKNPYKQIIKGCLENHPYAVALKLSVPNLYMLMALLYCTLFVVREFLSTQPSQLAILSRSALTS